MSVCGLAGGMHSQTVRRKRTRRLPAVNRQRRIVRQKIGRRMINFCAEWLVLVMPEGESRVLPVAVRANQE